MKFWKLYGIGNDFIAIDGRFEGEKFKNVASNGGCVKIEIEGFVYMIEPSIKICEGNLEV
jgi:diaminopimelate epimerase